MAWAREENTVSFVIDIPEVPLIRMSNHISYNINGLQHTCFINSPLNLARSGFICIQYKQLIFAHTNVFYVRVICYLCANDKKLLETERC